MFVPPDRRPAPTRSRSRPATRVRVVLAAALAVAIVGCGADDATTTTGSAAASASATTAAGDTTVPDATTADTAAPTTEAAPTTTAVVPTGWQMVVPGGDCQCADGTEYSFWVRRADPTKVVLFFQGGGACFSPESCAFGGGTYKPTTGAQDDPTGAAGVLDLDDPRNPLADYSFVFVPYCTGDVHIGDNTSAYSPELTVQHKGAINAAAAVGHLAAAFPDAAEVVVLGESAGGVGAPLYAGEVSDLLPDAEIVVIADSSGAYPDVPVMNAVLGTVWGTVNAIPPWPENAGQTVETWSAPGMYIQAGHHDPDITFARHDYAYDGIQAAFAAYAGVPSDQLLTLIDGNEAQIEAAGVDLASYVAPGSSHTVLSTPRFYTETFDGVAFLDWFTALVHGEPVADEHCVECAG
ncbi:MAG: pectin acetylesterase-family hydrolase [Ilumatobacteraceae bacterium]